MYASMRRCSVYLPVYLCVCVSRYVCMYAGMHVIGTYTYLFGLACTHTHTRTQTPNKVVRLLTRYGSPYTHSMSQTTVPGKVPSPKHRVSESRCKTSRCPCPELQVPVSENSQPYGHGLGLHTSFPCSNTQNARTYRNIEAGTPSHLLHTLANTAIDDDRYVFKFSSSCGNI